MTERAQLVLHEWLILNPGRGGHDLQDLVDRLYFAGFVEAKGRAADIALACARRSEVVAAIGAMELMP